jgi:hypothetical protein
MRVRNVGGLRTKLHDVITQKRGNVNVMYVIDMHKCGTFNGFGVLYNRCQLRSLPHNNTYDWLEHYQQLPPCVVHNSGAVFASVCWQKESLFVCNINSVYLHKKLMDVVSR